jgi:hypothetical protein
MNLFDGKPDLELIVDGTDLPLAGFPADVLAGMICAFLDELKGLPEKPGKIEVILTPRS